MDNKIISNTLILYVRTGITMFIAFYTSRIVLDVLGVENYGIYNLVAGVVAMFQTLSSTLSGASQRFITYALGLGDTKYLRQVFSASLKIHSYLAFFIVILGEIVGLWFVNSYLNIPHNRMGAVNVVYQFSLLSFVIDMGSLPYNSLLVAYERMRAYAMMYILQAVFRLMNVFLLQLFGFDKLILYAVLEFVVVVVMRTGMILFCRKEFVNCRYEAVTCSSLYKNMIQFTGWNFLGTSSAVVFNQGGNILLNIFFNVILNAARGISMQVQNAVTSFVSNFSIALNPQITKSYASGDYKHTISLLFSGSKVSVYLLMIIAIPIIVNADFILHLWLVEVPRYSVIFVQLSLLFSILSAFQTPLNCALFAIGSIKKYQLYGLFFNVAKIIFVYMTFRFCQSPISLYLIPILFCFLQLQMMLYLLKSYINFPVIDYYKKVVGRSLLLLASMICVSLLLKYIIAEMNLLVLMVESLITCFLSIAAIYKIGLTKSEKSKVRQVVIEKMK